MAIDTLPGIPRTDDKGTGGLLYVLLADYADVSVSENQDTGIATFTLADGTVIDSSNTPFKLFVMTKNSSNYTVTATGTPNQGTTFYDHVLTLVFARNEAAKRNAVQKFGKSELVAVAVDCNEEAVALGYARGLDLTGNVGTSGTAPADLNGQTVTLTASEPNPELIVESAQLAAITPA